MQTGRASDYSLIGDGFMYMSAEGYVLVSMGSRKNQKLQHRVIWEQAYGPIPEGYQIHHKNEDRSDNRLENLECLTVGQHKRLHAGWIRDETGEFVAKRCKTCKEIKPLSEYYTNYRKEHFIHCKECFREMRRKYPRGANKHADKSDNQRKDGYGA
jgi:hypothetical protein